MSIQDNIQLPSIKLNRVRLSYPSLFNLKVWPAKPNEKPKPGKYEATFIIDKDANKKEIELINSHIDKCLETLNTPRNKIKPDNMCLKDGDLDDKEEYVNAYTIKATSLNRFPIVNKDGVTPVHESDEIFYAGCYVSAYIDLWVYSKPNPGISCNLRAIQFVAGGDALGAPKFDISGKFESIEDEESLF
jgi:hypothetical protein